jgi:hypothetical protein
MRRTGEDPFQSTQAEVTEDVLSVLQKRPQSRHQPEARILHAVVGVFVGFDLDDQPLVKLPGVLAGEVLRARTAPKLSRALTGSAVVIVCEDGDPRRPIVLGVIEDSKPVAHISTDPVTVQADGDTYVVEAEREIVLRCGDASITLTRAGKVIIKGAYIVSHASGYNRIKGAAVDIN